MKPGLVVLGVFTFMTQWTSYLWPLVVSTREDMLTLTVGVQSLRSPIHGQLGACSRPALCFRCCRSSSSSSFCNAISSPGRSPARSRSNVGHVELLRSANDMATPRLSRRSHSASRTTSSWCCWGRRAAERARCLKMIAGLEDVSDGEIYIDGKLVNYVPPGRSQRGDGFSELCPLPAHDRRRKYRVPLEDDWRLEA